MRVSVAIEECQNLIEYAAELMAAIDRGDTDAAKEKAEHIQHAALGVLNEVSKAK